MLEHTLVIALVPNLTLASSVSPQVEGDMKDHNLTRPQGAAANLVY